MIEQIGIVASILGIIGAIWAFIKFVFNPFFKRREEFKNICVVVEDSFTRWQKFDFSLRGGAMISPNDFLIVNKYRSKFNGKSSELKSYLFRNAIQNGLGGNWGYWLEMNKDNESILLPLFLALDKSGGLRPTWRSAFILEKIFQHNVNEIDSFIAKYEKLKLNNHAIFDIIKSKKVESEILNKSKKGKKEEKEKMPFLIDELEKFSKEIDTFTKTQTIIKS
jgi:hypothetical protein